MLSGQRLMLIYQDSSDEEENELDGESVENQQENVVIDESFSM